jgi:hypothetical protein
VPRKSVLKKTKSSRRSKSAPSFGGKRAGTKRSDKRWIADDGTEWASRFEYGVFKTLSEKGYAVERCIQGQDSLSYRAAVRLGKCDSCGSSSVHTERSYTPDIRVRAKPGSASLSGRPGYLLETKGYLRGPQRTLLRAFRKSRPDVDLRFIFQRDYPVTKQLSIAQWCAKYLKAPHCVWSGDLPEEWK